MKKYAEYLILIAIFVIGLCFRSYFSLSSTDYDNSNAYFVIRNVESIEQSKLPLYHDEKSYGGRENVLSPGYYYILYLSHKFFPDYITFKFLPNLFACLAIIAMYLIVKKLTKNMQVALFSSFISIFLPVFLKETTDTASVYSLVVPLTLFCLYFFIATEKENDISILWYIIALAALCLISGSAALLVGVFVMYYLILKVEEIKLSKIKMEMLLFSLFFILWIEFLVYKKALLFHGLYVIWQNIPSEMLMNYFDKVNIFQIIYYVGIIPFILGLYSIYRFSFKIKSEETYIFLSFALVTTLLLIFRLIPFNMGLIFFGICFIIFFGLGYKIMMVYLEKTKFNKYKAWLVIGILVILFFTSIMPSIALLQERTVINNNKLNALYWIKNNTPENSTVLGTIEEGNLITYIAERKNVIDSNFLMVDGVNQRIADLRIIYTSPSVVKATELLNYYSVDYILVDSAKEDYNIKDLRYSESDCLKELYSNNTKVYQVMCKVDVI
jgi:hypothetical protein